MVETRHDVLIVGGGISGLATAWWLQRGGVDVAVLEAGNQPGGAMGTAEHEGFLVESGPNSLLVNDPTIDELIEGVGLVDARVEANRLARRRYVCKHGALIPLPASPGQFIRTPLFSARGKLRLLAEPFFGRAEVEESVADFVTRRLGREFLDWAIDPFVSGVYAGDPRRLSVRAATARVHALEREHGSLLLGALKKMLFEKHRGGAGPGGRMISFTEGLQALPRAIADSLGERLHLQAAVERLEREDEGWRVVADGRTFAARRVVLALPAAGAARLLGEHDAELAAELEAIVYPAVASVALGYRRDQVEHALDGFGFLIPRREGVETLGALFSSTLFPGRAPDDHVLLTAFLGGRQHPQVAEMDTAGMAAQVHADLAGLLGIDGEPVMRQVNYWPRAIPQYELGHLDRERRIEDRLEGLPGLELRASYLGGISVSDCIKNARAAARALGGT